MQLRPALFVAIGLAGVLGSCATAPSPGTQAIVDSMMAHHTDIVRLTVHTTPPGGGATCAVASSLASKRGKPSDPEDLKAMATGKNVILMEQGALDITVPILQKDGKHTAAAGVTLKMPMGSRQEELVARAESIAREIEHGMTANPKPK